MGARSIGGAPRQRCGARRGALSLTLTLTLTLNLAVTLTLT